MNLTQKLTFGLILSLSSLLAGCASDGLDAADGEEEEGVEAAGEDESALDISFDKDVTAGRCTAHLKAITGALGMEAAYVYAGGFARCPNSPTFRESASGDPWSIETTVRYSSLPSFLAPSVVFRGTCTNKTLDRGSYFPRTPKVGYYRVTFVVKSGGQTRTARTATLEYSGH